jgi:hypothetical protein
MRRSGTFDMSHRFIGEGIMCPVDLGLDLKSQDGAVESNGSSAIARRD